jgi:phage-related minor tail protein
VDTFPDNSLTANFTASSSASRSQDMPQVGSATAASLPENGPTEILSTEKALDEADQAVNSMQPVLGIALTTANIIAAAPDIIDDVVSVYKTWEEVVATLKAVMVIVDKIAEVIVNWLPMIELNVSSDPPICEDGMERAFRYPQGCAHCLI